MIYTNNSDISLEMAVWLLNDEYDYVNESNYISATAMMKPIRHIILPGRIPEGERVVPDVEDLIPSALGHALHAAIERSWENGRHRKALKLLGYSDTVIDRVLVNPTPEQLAAVQNPIPVYIEQRTKKQIVVNGETFTVGGKFDMVCEGRVTDTKSTSVWAWILGGRDEDYQLQGSIYRWLNQDKITEDYIRVNFLFTDWSKYDAVVKAEQGYPPRRVMHKDIPLLSVEETEAWIRAKIVRVVQYRKTPEDSLPECTPEELWMSDPEFKYYSDPSKVGQPGTRSTKNFKPKDYPDALAAANAFMREKGKGVVVTVPGQPKRCGYCAAFPICTQKDKYTHD